MSISAGNRSATQGGSGNPLLTGILVGMVIGVAMAAGLAWYLMRSPSPFMQNEPVVVQPPVAQTVAPTGIVAAESHTAKPSSAVGESKPRFEFYKVLTDKPGATVMQKKKPVEKPAQVKPAAETAKPVAVVKEAQFLQAGSFPNADDAEKLKARLAMMGIEASIQTANLPDKGVWHRVRTGPYKNPEELDKARTMMKQNGVDTTPIRQ